MSADSENGEGTGGRRLKLKWLENPNHERARRSNKQERRVASELGGRRIKNSGGARWSKHDGSTDGGDVATPEFHVEQKTTKKASMSLKRAWLGKVREGARKFGKDPAIVITFDDPNKPYDPPEDWILVPIDVARRVLGYHDED